jgi:hypothetical protein
MQKLKKIFFSLLILALPLWSAAQCSVCAAGVASNLKEGGSIGKGINTGILYLLSFPYIVFVGFMIYRYREFLGFQFRSIVQRWRMFRASL